MSDFKVMSTTLGHFKSKPTARALFNEADKQVGWVFVENSLGHPLNLIISIAESEYKKSPYHFLLKAQIYVEKARTIWR